MHSGVIWGMWDIFFKTYDLHLSFSPKWALKKRNTEGKFSLKLIYVCFLSVSSRIIKSLVHRLLKHILDQGKCWCWKHLLPLCGWLNKSSISFGPVGNIASQRTWRRWITQMLPESSLCINPIYPRGITDSRKKTKTKT